MRYSILRENELTVVLSIFPDNSAISLSSVIVTRTRVKRLRNVNRKSIKRHYLISVSWLHRKIVFG